MSGTSLDGIDIALVKINSDTHFEFVTAETISYPAQLHDKLYSIITQTSCSLKQYGQLDMELGQFIAEQVNLFLIKQNLTATQINAIGNHGQTIYHLPDDQFAFSLQIGNNNTISELTRITTVGDFRQRDIAAGGQGAPLVPAFHQHLFSSSQQNRVILNIGGISNITYLPKDTQSTVRGFDTGPGNGLSDIWIQRHKSKPYDKNGDWAASGQCHTLLLKNMLQDPYFQQAIPKSTGREHFNLSWIDNHLALLTDKVAAEDVQATLIELTAQSISRDIDRYCPECDTIYICGGGAHNPVLVGRISALNTHRNITTTDSLGLNADWVEASAFAWLAYRTRHGLNGNLPSVTGAKKAVPLGAVYSFKESS